VLGQQAQHHLGVKGGVKEMYSTLHLCCYHDVVIKPVQSIYIFHRKAGIISAFSQYFQYGLVEFQ